MKKIFSAVLSALVVAALTVPVFAGFTQEEAVMEVKFDIQKATTTPVMDGKMSDGEYYEVELQKSWISAYVDDDNNAEAALNTNPKLYMSWDDNYVYTYTEISTPNFTNEWDSDPGQMWQSACIQVCASESGSTAGNSLEYGIALSSETNEMLKVIWIDYLSSGFDPVANEDFAVVKNGDVVTYECRTPYSAFISDGKLAEGDDFLFCLVWSTGDIGDVMQTQLASGCTGNGKNADYFAQVKLAPAPVVETEPVVEETTAPAAEESVEAAAETIAETTTDVVEAPQTADVFSVIAAAAVISAGAVLVSKKK